MEYGNHYLDPREDELSHDVLQTVPQPPTVPGVPGVPGVPAWVEDAVGAFVIFALLFTYMAI